jgi:hypothetical protein
MEPNKLTVFIPLKFGPYVCGVISYFHLCMGRGKKKYKEEKNGCFFHGLNLQQDKN